MEDAIFEGGMTRAQARAMSPFELFQAIEGARFRAMREADAQIYAAYVMMKTWMGRKTPKFEKVLGRKSANHFKNECLGRNRKDEKKIAEQMKTLRAKVEGKKP